jgi:hypothetical protein
MKSDKKNSFLPNLPSGVLALLTSIAAIFVVLCYVVIYGFLTFARHDDEIIGSTIIPLTLYLSIIIIFNILIVRQNPHSFWYVPIITNLVGIIVAFIKSGFWNEPSFWIPVSGGWLLSIISSIIGARMGRRNFISNNPDSVKG